MKRKSGNHNGTDTDLQGIFWREGRVKLTNNYRAEAKHSNTVA